MKKTILKYPLEMGMNVLEIPGGLCGGTVAHQPGQEKGVVQLWTMARKDQPVELAHVYLAVTGETIPENLYPSFLGTVLLNGGAFVVHALVV